MARIFQEQQKKGESNPLYGLCNKVSTRVEELIGTYAMDILYKDGIMTPTQFSYYVVFEAVAERIREEQRKEGRPVNQYLKELCQTNPNDSLLAKDSDGINYEDTYKKVSKIIGLRKEFMDAEICRHKLAYDSDTVQWMQKMNERSNLREGYRFTSLQFEQIHDNDDFFIKKVHELRRFINPKHAPNRDVVQYYDSLVKHAERCFAAPDARTRVTSAINLNDFENRNLSFFLYRVAKYCFEHGIKEIDEVAESHLLAICAAVNVNFDHARILVTHKPVLSMMDHIPAAMSNSSWDIDQYVALELLGCSLRIGELPHMLNQLQYTYEDIDQFICGPAPFLGYNVFQIYAPVEWDEKGKIIALLRQLIAKLTVDPLSK